MPTLREPDPIMREWPAAERPTVRLLAGGAASLSDAEVLAVLLRRGARDASAVDLARRELTRAGSVSALAMAPGGALDPEQIARVRAAVELTRRTLMDQARTRDALTSPAAVRDYLRLTLAGREYEAFVVVFVDSQHRVIQCEELFRGTLDQTSVYPREVVKAALAANAAAVIFAHNHPSGAAQPSQADELITWRLKDALALIEVKVLDHFIVAGGITLSFAERGLL